MRVLRHEPAYRLRDLLQVTPPPGLSNDYLFASGSDALTACLRSTNGRGSEVIVPAYTCDRVVTAVAEAGMTPVFCDVSSADGLMTAEQVGHRLSKDTRAVVATNIYGNAPDMHEMRRCVDEVGAALIEDSALRLPDPGELSLSDATVHSYGRGKSLAIGAGGRLAIHSPDLIGSTQRVQARSWRQHSRVLAYWRPIWWCQSQLAGLIRRDPPGGGQLLGSRITGEAATPTVAHLISIASQPERIASAATHRRSIDSIYLTDLAWSDRLRQLSGARAVGLTPGFAILVQDRANTWRQLKGHGIDVSTAFSYSVGSIASMHSYPRSESIAAGILVLPNHHHVTPTLARAICEIVNAH